MQYLDKRINIWLSVTVIMFMKMCQRKVVDGDKHCGTLHIYGAYNPKLINKYTNEEFNIFDILEII